MTDETQATAAIEAVAEIAASVVETENEEAARARQVAEEILKAQAESDRERRLTEMEARHNTNLAELDGKVNECRSSLETIRTQLNELATRLPPIVVLEAPATETLEQPISDQSPLSPQSEPNADISDASPSEAPEPSPAPERRKKFF